jgi:hypothetical protein
MYLIQPVTFEPDRMAPTLRGHEHGDLPVDDPPPKDHPGERYAAWNSTAIFTLAPFSAPPGR